MPIDDILKSEYIYTSTSRKDKKHICNKESVYNKEEHLKIQNNQINDYEKE